MNMFEHDHSAARGKMAARKLFVFKHKDKLGNAPAHKLFERVKVTRATDPKSPPRAFSDYKIQLEGSDTPGVDVDEKI